MNFKYHKFTGRWVAEIDATNRIFAEITFYLSASRYIEITAYIEQETDKPSGVTTVEPLGNYDVEISICDIAKNGEIIPIEIDNEKKVLTCKINEA